jgi:hypothetical protein
MEQRSPGVWLKSGVFIGSPGRPMWRKVFIDLSEALTYLLMLRSPQKNSVIPAQAGIQTVVVRRTPYRFPPTRE